MSSKIDSVRTSVREILGTAMENGFNVLLKSDIDANDVFNVMIGELVPLLAATISTGNVLMGGDINGRLDKIADQLKAQVLNGSSAGDEYMKSNGGTQ